MPSSAVLLMKGFHLFPPKGARNPIPNRSSTCFAASSNPSLRRIGITSRRISPRILGRASFPPARMTGVLPRTAEYSSPMRPSPSFSANPTVSTPAFLAAALVTISSMSALLPVRPSGPVGAPTQEAGSVTTSPAKPRRFPIIPAIPWSPMYSSAT